MESLQGKPMYLHDIELSLHQKSAVQLFETGFQNEWPILVVECDSKICPGDRAIVIAVAVPNPGKNALELVPICRLFEEPPLQQLCAPKILGVPLTVHKIENNVIGGYWELPLH